MNPAEEEVETSLRPKSFDDYVGQDKVKANLRVFIEASKKRKDALDHVLLYGPPGLGKTTMSHIIANELGVPIKITSGPAIEHAGDLAAILTNLEENEVLFVDEIHALNRSVEEKLYSAFTTRIEREKMKLFAQNEKLKSLNPLSVLGRGFSVAFGGDGKAIRSVSELPAGTEFELMLADGKTKAVSK